MHHFRDRRIIRALAIALGIAWLGIGCSSGTAARSNTVSTPPGPRVHHILLEVKDLKRSIAFYRDQFGLKLKSSSGSFAILEAANIGIYLWSERWDWEKPRAPGERQGLGMYPHLEFTDVVAAVERLRQAGCTVVMEPRKFSHGTEAFVADPDGYVWSLITPQ